MKAALDLGMRLSSLSNYVGFSNFAEIMVIV